jgi:hypothetical protein
MSEVKNVSIRGLIDTYEFECTLPGSGEKLKIKPITTGQMKKILVHEGETDPSIIEDALDNLVSGCVVTEGFNLDDLYLQDRFFLLLEIRKISKGGAYPFTYKCPKCQQETVGAVDLSALNVKTKIDEKPILKINDNLSFEVDFPKRKDQKQAAKHVRGKGKISPSAFTAEVMTTTLALSITKVIANGQELDGVPIEDKIYILDNVKSSVFNEFRRWFDDNDFGVDFTVNIKCAHCPNEQKIDIPLSDFFA